MQEGSKIDSSWMENQLYISSISLLCYIQYACNFYTQSKIPLYFRLTRMVPSRCRWLTTTNFFLIRLSKMLQLKFYIAVLVFFPVNNLKVKATGWFFVWLIICIIIHFIFICIRLANTFQLNMAIWDHGTKLYSNGNFTRI